MKQELEKIIEKINEMKGIQKQYSKKVETLEIIIFDNPDDIDSKMMLNGYTEEIQRIQRYIERKFGEIGQLQYSNRR